MFDTSGTLSYTGKVKTKDVNWNQKKHVYGKGYEYTFNESIKSFAGAYCMGEQPESSGEDGLRIMAMEKAVSKSSIAHSEIYLDGSKRNE